MKEALDQYGAPEIMNTGQGGQFTGFEWPNTLKDAKVKISTDGRGRWIDNRMVERLWRSLKYECVYLNAFETGSEAKTGIGRWMTYYNAERPHSTHGLAPLPVRLTLTMGSSISAYSRRARSEHTEASVEHICLNLPAEPLEDRVALAKLIRGFPTLRTIERKETHLQRAQISNERLLPM